MQLDPPVRYTPSVEQVGSDESETVGELNETFHDILETTSKDYGHAVRAVHAKPHGVIEGTLTITDGLPPELAQGLFARPGRYQAIARISTNPGDILDDSISLPRGFALKLIDVPGDRLPGSEGTTTQDFVLVNGPVFLAKTPKEFLGNLKLLAKTADKVEWAKKALSTVLRGAEATVEAFGGESAKLTSLGGAPNSHPLGESYYSQSAFRFGDHIGKFGLFPVSPDLLAFTGEVIDASGRPNAIREDLQAAMKQADGVWELRVQLCRDLDAMPVEDPTVQWDENASPYLTVATLHMPAQDSWDETRVRAVDDTMRYSVWTGLAAHQPLGAINRARKSAYEMSSDFRARFNGCPIHEPATVNEGA